MKIIGTAEDADRLLEVLMHIVPYINEVTKQMKSAAGLFAESCRDEECQQIMEVLGKVDYTLWNALDDITALREILSDYRDILAAGQENPTVAEQSSLGSPGQYEAAGEVSQRPPGVCLWVSSDGKRATGL